MTATHGRAATPVELLDGHGPGDFLLATAERTIAAAGARRVLDGAEADTVAAALRESGAPLAVGALPFTPSADGADLAHLVVPESVRTSGPLHPALAGRERRALPEPVATTAVPEPERHMRAVEEAVRALRANRLRKVVLARALDLDFAETVTGRSILANLAADNPAGYTFAAPLPGGRTLVGSTPELLVSRSGDRIRSHPHAGSAPRSADPATDAERGRQLAASVKDQAEHAVLTEMIAETLRPFCRTLDVPATPSLEANPAVWHLTTTITGELADPGITALHLAEALHPTPAICGTPTDAARAAIGELEPFDRGYYAGAVGWVDAAGDGEWAIAIRCAEIAGTRMRLYAGGGIMPGSEAADELAETSAKFRVLLRAMGLDLGL
ncbi:isochorismate synthase [Amycolatopsis antarctica]|uniref:isochorismate synthase n=1 Tax=Amycolatopsis antarctica TaxID=1854586 RepID=A0A263CZS5_9PSEU|nr:isochorismate synthase [Amycolatopsis antarctica]OZM70605.1 isochorismate synthase [Amycolatopsis antarctica]